MATRRPARTRAGATFEERRSYYEGPTGRNGIKGRAEARRRRLREYHDLDYQREACRRDLDEIATDITAARGGAPLAARRLHNAHRLLAYLHPLAPASPEVRQLLDQHTDAKRALLEAARDAWTLTEK